MPATSIDQLLAKARLTIPAYTNDELAAAQARLAAAATDRLLSGALTFDDATACDLWTERAYPDVWEHRADWDTYTDDEARERLEASNALHHMCELIIAEPAALHTMRTFVSDSTGSEPDPTRILEPEGARVLACVLHLAGREDSARFWWQFAAGADDDFAKLFLLFHHLALGESKAAHWWRRQIPLRDRGGWISTILNRRQAEAAHALRIVSQMRPVSENISAVLGYVKDAVRFVDDVDLPLPADGFAKRIEEMTTGV
jgi:hypothetical protein